MLISGLFVGKKWMLIIINGNIKLKYNNTCRTKEIKMYTVSNNL